MGFPTPLSALADAIAIFEGGFQDMPEDSGNWINCAEGRRLVGTMRGVTPAALAQHLGIDKCSLTPGKMRSLVTAEVAAALGLKGYYDQPGFDDLEWSPLVEVAVDIGWGSGPQKAIKMLQQLVGAVVDGRIGPQTVAAYQRAIHARPMAELVDALSLARREFYIRISLPGDKDHKFQRGWLRRADYYTTRGNGVDEPWWPKWAGWKPSGASGTSRPVEPARAPLPPPPPVRAEHAPAAPRERGGFLAALFRFLASLFRRSR